MRFLLSGATGFVGSHLIAQLLESGHEVVGIQRNGSLPRISLIHEPTWLNKGLTELTINDLRNFDVVVHLASAGVSPQKASWQEMVQINAAAGLQLIELAHQAGVKRFVAAGSCLEYGSEAEVWDTIPPNAALRPITPYAASKAAGFFMLHAFASNNPIELFYGRIFSVYGEGQFSENLWPAMREAALIGADFPMTEGNQIRDFIPVNEVARHLQFAAERRDLKLLEPLVVNIGSGNGMRVVDFARQQWSQFGATGSLKPGKIASRPGEMPRLVADTVNLNSKSI